MIRYEVALVVESSIREGLSRYMREEHIPEVLATGCFAGAHFDRTPDGFRTSYLAATQHDLDRYLERHAVVLRDRFARCFPDGIVASRQVLETLQNWD